jgi:hypothetical protein
MYAEKIIKNRVIIVLDLIKTKERLTERDSKTLEQKNIKFSNFLLLFYFIEKTLNKNKISYCLYMTIACFNG